MPRLKNCLCRVGLLITVLMIASPAMWAEESSRPGRVPITPVWALECWLWEQDHETEAYVYELIKGYEEHDFPARTIILDSGWATRYNDFKMDPAKHPGTEKFIRDLRSRGYRVILWMTPMVNSQSDNTAIKDSLDWFNEAKSKGYLAGNGYKQEWWHGVGGFIDYTNPDAMKWWHGMQEEVLSWGIDGWKLDDCALYYNSPIGRIVGVSDMPPLSERVGQGWMSTREYMDHYYRDEYQHGLTKNPEFITLARAIDGIPHPEGFSPMDASPVCWVGDQNHEWAAKDEGIEEALNYILASAKLGYCIVGSDVAGYHGRTPIQGELYVRWAQFSTFCGLFLNGGHGDREVWTYPAEIYEPIHRAAWLHQELVPYIHSHDVDCHNGGKPLIRPLGRLNKTGVADDDYRYLFGDDFLIAPIHEDRTQWSVKIPEGKWRYFFNDDEVITGPATIERDFPLGEFPIYVREGAVIPMNVTRPYTGLGGKDSDGFVTWNIYPNSEATAGSTFTLHNTDGSGDTKADVKGSLAGSKLGLEVALAGQVKPHILRIFLDQKPSEVALNGQALKDGGQWRYDSAEHRLWIKKSEPGEATYVIHP